jgi:hypothetical protein
MVASVAGMPTNLFFRGLDQSDEDIQRRMIAAWMKVMDTSAYISRELSPKVVWLTAFQQYVAIAEPGAMGAGGVVRQPRFYPLLQRFLQAQVLAHLQPCPTLASLNK